MYRVLLALALLLVLAILVGTLYALVLRPKAASSPQAVPSSSSSAATTPPAAPDVGIFTGLGRLRCPTAAGPANSGPGMVIFQAAFPYYPGDRPFSEELVSRIREMRALSAAYFAALTLEELGRKDEAEVKAELLSRYNALLRLGQIEALYFNEYMIIE